MLTTTWKAYWFKNSSKKVCMLSSICFKTLATKGTYALDYCAGICGGERTGKRGYALNYLVDIWRFKTVAKLWYVGDYWEGIKRWFRSGKRLVCWPLLCGHKGSSTLAKRLFMSGTTLEAYVV